MPLCYPSISLCICDLCICTEPSGPWSPLLHSKSRLLLAQARTETPLFIFISMADAERHLPDVAKEPLRWSALGEPSGCSWGRSPCVLDCFLPSNVITFLLWCNIVVQEHNVSLRASVTCWGHAHLQAPHLRYLEAKQAGMERVCSRLSQGRNPVLLALCLAY